MTPMTLTKTIQFATSFSAATVTTSRNIPLSRRNKCIASISSPLLLLPSTLVEQRSLVSSITNNEKHKLNNNNNHNNNTKTLFVNSAALSPSSDEENTNDTTSVSSNIATDGIDMDELFKLASNKVTPLSLKEMYKYAIIDADNPEQRIRNAKFLHNELPIRIAQRAVDLLTLPHGLNEIPTVLQVAHVYLLYLEKFNDCSIPTDVESEDLFTDMLQSMVLERSSIPNAIARGVDAWMKSVAEEERQENSDTDSSENSAMHEDEKQQKKERNAEMEDALYRFFTARVGLRFLTEHHILSSPFRAANLGLIKDDDNKSSCIKIDKDGKDATFLGCIQPNCSPSGEVSKVVEAVRKQTMDYYDGGCPEIQIVNGDINPTEKNNNFTYVPHHLHYMVGELLKNSCRATVKSHIENSVAGEDIPPIKIVIVKGAEDVTIKIADRGGGIPRSKMSHIWQFAHSTADENEVENEAAFGVDEITGGPIRGFGLPLARIYARYLGGDITLKSLEGYGVDAYLHLPRLGDNCENLPLPVQFSPSNLNSNPRRIRK